MAAGGASLHRWWSPRFEQPSFVATDPFKGMDSCVSIDAPKNFRIKGVNVVDRQPGKPASTVRWWTDEAAEAERMSELWHKGQPRHGMEDKGDDSCVSVEAPEWMRTYGSPVAVRTGDQKRPFVSAKWWKYEEDAAAAVNSTQPLVYRGAQYTRARARARASPPRSTCARRARAPREARRARARAGRRRAAAARPQTSGARCASASAGARRAAACA